MTVDIVFQYLVYSNLDGPKTKCYDCGYMQINNDPPAHLPETDPAAFCGDFANPSEIYSFVLTFVN